VELRATRLHCRMGTFTLGPLDVHLPTGASLALVGPNGSGKSTLLRALCGLLPSQGDLWLNGQALARMGARERARAICLLPQQEEGGGSFTVEDYVLLGRHAHMGLLEHYSASDRAHATEAMERTGCAAWRARRLDTLSGGERQLVRLAAALAQEARILLLDEPGTFLDPGQRRRLWRRLQEARRDKGLGLILVTHDLNEALEGADTVLALDKGQVLRQGAASLLLEGDWAGRLFGLPLQAVTVPGRARPYLVEASGSPLDDGRP